MTVDGPEHPDWRQLDPTLEFESAALRELLAFWEQIRDGRDLPDRDDFSPLDIRRQLGWVILLDVEPQPRRFRFRLIGSGITSVLSRDSTGRYLDELYDPGIYEDTVAPYEYVVERRQPVRSIGRMVHAEKGHIRYEAIYLPFSAGSADVEMVMEGVQYEGFG